MQELFLGDVPINYRTVPSRKKKHGEKQLEIMKKQ